MTDHTNGNYRNTSSTSTLTGLTYLLIGGGIGAAAALLLTPKSGVDMRHGLSDATRKGYDGTLDLAKRVKERSLGLYRTAVERGKRTDEGAADILELGSVQNPLSGSSSDAARSTSPKESPTKGREFGRKSSAII